MKPDEITDKMLTEKVITLSDIKSSKSAAAKMLGTKGLAFAHQFTVRLRPVSRLHKDSDWIALYRGSVFSGTPIFWIAADHPDYAEVDNLQWMVTDSILHEWYHAIMDACTARNPKKVKKLVNCAGYGTEDDAEEFMRWVTGNSSDKEAAFKNLIQLTTAR